MATYEKDELDAVFRWLARNRPSNLVKLIRRVNRIRVSNRRVHGSRIVEKAIESAYWLGRQSLTCAECGDYIPPDDAYCDCWRDVKRQW